MTLDIIEVAAMALCKSHLPKGWALASDEERALYRELAGSVIVFVAPLVRAAALEEAAKVAEDEDGEYSWAGEHRNMALLQQHSRELAAAIRAAVGAPAALARILSTIDALSTGPTDTFVTIYLSSHGTPHQRPEKC